ncbi:MAG: flagellar hook-length control protein FliK [Gammaproteobacteria bacterium]
MIAGSPELNSMLASLGVPPSALSSPERLQNAIKGLNPEQTHRFEEFLRRYVESRVTPGTDSPGAVSLAPLEGEMMVGAQGTPTSLAGLPGKPPAARGKGLPGQEPPPNLTELLALLAQLFPGVKPAAVSGGAVSTGNLRFAALVGQGKSGVVSGLTLSSQGNAHSASSQSADAAAGAQAHAQAQALNRWLAELLSGANGGNSSTGAASGLLQPHGTGIAIPLALPHLAAGASPQPPLMQSPNPALGAVQAALMATHGGPAALTGDPSAAAAHAPPPLNLPPSHPAWPGDLGSRVQWMLDRQLSSANLRLNPPDLGPLEVRVTVHQDQAQVSFASHQVLVRDALEAALPKLREMLAGNGLTLAGVNISHHSMTDRGHHDGSDSNFGGTQGRVSGVAGAGGVDANSPGSALRAMAVGLLDLYA